MKTKGFVALLAAAFILGTFGVWIRELDKVFTNESQVVIRSLFASLFIAAIIAYKRLKVQLPKSMRKSMLGFSVVFPLSIISFTYAATEIKVSNALFMLYAGSLLATYLWGKFAFGEKMDAKKVASIMLLVIGLYTFVHPFSAATISLGVLAGIAAGLLEGSAHAFRKKLKEVPREIVVFFQSVSGLLVGSLLFLFSGDSFTKTELTASSVLVAILFGTLLVAIGYLLAYGFGNFDVNVGTIVLATELFFALIINYVFLSESPTRNELIGGLLIFAGSIVTSLDTDRFKARFINKSAKID